MAASAPPRHTAAYATILLQYLLVTLLVVVADLRHLLVEALTVVRSRLLLVVGWVNVDLARCIALDLLEVELLKILMLERLHRTSKRKGQGDGENNR